MITTIIVIGVIAMYIIIDIITAMFIVKSYNKGYALLHETNIPPKHTMLSGDDIIQSVSDEAIMWGIFWPIFWVLLVLKLIACYIMYSFELFKYYLEK